MLNAVKVCYCQRGKKEKGNSGNDGGWESVMWNDGGQLAGDMALWKHVSRAGGGVLTSCSISLIRLQTHVHGRNLGIKNWLYRPGFKICSAVAADWNALICSTVIDAASWTLAVGQNCWKNWNINCNENTVQLKITNSILVAIGNLPPPKKSCYIFESTKNALCAAICCKENRSAFLLFRGDESPYSTSRGSCLEPKDLSESLHLNQISIFMSGRFKHWVGNQYNLNCSGCIPAQMGLSPDPLKLPQIAFRVCFFFFSPHFVSSPHAELVKKKKKKNCATASHHFYSLPHSLTVTPVAFFCLCLTVLTRHRDSGSSGDEAAEVARQRKEERERTSLRAGRMGLGALFSDQHMCVFLWQCMGEGV